MGIAKSSVARLVVRKIILLLLVLVLVLTVEFLFFRVGMGEYGYRTNYGHGPVPEQLHFGDNVVVQYLYFIVGMLGGGGSFNVYSQSAHVAVGEAVSQSIGWSLVVFGPALVLSLALGILAARFIWRTKHRRGRIIGQSSMLLLWTLPVILVAAFVFIQVEMRFAYDWVASPSADYLRKSLMPIAVLTLCSFGGFALIALQGMRRARFSSAEPVPGGDSHPVSMAESILSVMPIMKLNIAFMMTMLFVIEPFWHLNGLGRRVMLGSSNIDLVLVEASMFVILVIVLVSGFLLDLSLSLLALRTSRVLPVTVQSPIGEEAPSAKERAVDGRNARGMFAELKWFCSTYVRRVSGLVGGVMLVAFALLALAGPEVAGPVQQSIFSNPNPVPAFLAGSRYSLLFTLGVLALSLVVGLGVALFVLPLGKFNYPVILIAECFLVFPIFGMIFMLANVNSGIRPGIWVAIIGTVLVTWAAVALTVLTRAKEFSGRLKPEKPESTRAARYRNVVTAGLRGTLPDVLASLKYVAAIAPLSLIAYQYGYGSPLIPSTWGGMLSYCLQTRRFFNFDIWWILPLTGTIMMISSFYLVLQTTQDILEGRPGTDRLSAAVSVQHTS